MTQVNNIFEMIPWVSDMLSAMAAPLLAMASTGIVLTCISVINRMTPKTDHLIRIFYTTIATGAFGELFSLLTGRLPTLAETLITVGIALLFLFDRRSGYKARPPRNCPCPYLNDKVRL